MEAHAGKYLTLASFASKFQSNPEKTDIVYYGNRLVASRRFIEYIRLFLGYFDGALTIYNGVFGTYRPKEVHFSGRRLIKRQ